MKFLKNLLGKLTGFLSNTGLVWFGYLGGAIALLIFMPQTDFWVFIEGLLVGGFLMKNFEEIKNWADEKIEDIKDKF